MHNPTEKPLAISTPLLQLRADISGLQTVRRVGRVQEVVRGTILVSGLSRIAGLGDQVEIRLSSRHKLRGEILQLTRKIVTVIPDQSIDGVSIGDEVVLFGPGEIFPDSGWIGRVIDPDGRPLDGDQLPKGANSWPLCRPPPPATMRRRLGERLETGIAVFNTLLPLVRGQRMGLFAGSGVGKSTLLSKFARGVEADIVVIALIGERGREVREFVDEVLGPDGMKRAVVVAATSDQSPLVRRRCAWTAMTIAEFFRDQGLHVLLLADSVTRIAEAHREIALASGEQASLRGFPPSATSVITSFCERAGPGMENSGDITAVFTILVAASDMDEPVADILRGVLDGHVVMDRKIAERGRFPAVDLLRSVSRSLPRAASAGENDLIEIARRLLGSYDQAEVMIQAGLYAAGSDPLIDAAIEVWPSLDGFLGEDTSENIAADFSRLSEVLKSGESDLTEGTSESAL